jgi:hypothetical protein
MTNDAERLFKLEQRMQQQIKQLAAVQQQLADVAQKQWAPPMTPQGGGSGNILWCSPSGTIAAATGPPSTGTPGGPLAAQDLYRISGGAFVAGPTGVDLYNGMRSGVVITKTCAVIQNTDGSYSVISQSCA